jgi:hypothetical protein
MNLLKKFNVLIYFFFITLPVSMHSQTNDNSFLYKEFNLAGSRSQEEQFFLMESKLVTYALDGKRTGTDIFRLHIKSVPGEDDKYSCLRFTVQLGDSPEVEIPELRNWTYIYNDPQNLDKDYVFGIDHTKFENLVDSEGIPLSFENSYHIYNAFIDFHGFCSLFPEPTPEGNGIQDLKYIGDKIIHDAAFTDAPTNLGKNISEGSSFKNGEITLEFKGLSYVNDKECALLGFDSGESSFKMIMNPVPDMEIVTVGSSHYKGDIYKDLNTNWVQKVTLNEFVISETSLPMPPNKINAVIERNILIKNVSQEEFFNY